jgi:toxin ParE1/3/4
MRRLQFSFRAAEDLELIEDYISRDNPDAAKDLVLLIRKKCQLLSEQPGIGRDRSDLLSGLRGVPVGNYIIFYHAVEDGIEVIRVLHGAQDLPELF